VNTKWLNIQTTLDAGGVALLPTETVYGLAARADMAEAISKVYAIKGRNFDKPLAVCVRDINQAETLAYFDDTSARLAASYWPGPLTLVLDLREGAVLDPRVTGDINGTRTIALRCPDAQWRQAIGAPLGLTSANRSGQPDCIEYSAAMTELGHEVTASLPAQAPLSGQPSSIIRVEKGQLTLLRQGALEISL